MLNRRHLRIKILQALYAFEQGQGQSIAKAEKDLMYHIQKMYEMYLFLMQVMIEIRDVAARKIEDNKNKRLPTDEDLRPNTRFIDNRFLIQLDANKALKAAAEKHKTNWMGEGELLRRFFKQLSETSEYKSYMTAPKKLTYADDHEVVIRLFKRHLINYPDLHEFFEERSIHWIDDLDLVASMTLKTFKTFTEAVDEFHGLLPLWKEPEDELPFVQTLFRKTLVNSEEHAALIHKHTENWELDRIAVMDVILMKMALTEAIEFPQIPVKVTLNEYIELAKYYSTPKSSNFINGVLDKLFSELQTGGQIKKLGRGLIS
jgi:N utilization substance protein B